MVQPNATAPVPSPEEYFRAIEQSFWQTLTEQSEFSWSGFVGRVTFTTPLILVVPLLLGLLVAKIGLKLHLQFRYSWLTNWTNSQPFWVVLTVVVFMAVAIIMSANYIHQTEKARANWLSEPQMRFCYCYAFTDEILHYQSDRLPKHLESAFRFWRLLLNSLYAELNGTRITIPLPSTSTFMLLSKSIPKLLPGSVERVRQSFSWFRVDKNAATILAALEMLPSKLNFRIRDGKDLPAVTEAIRALGNYFYSAIPQVALESEEAQARIVAAGEMQLVTFSEKVLGLSEYSWEAEPSSPSFWKKFGAWVYAQTRIFSHDNMLVCFVAWLVLSSVLVAGAIRALLYWLPALKFDSTLASVAISAPLITAATLVALSRKRRV